MEAGITSPRTSPARFSDFQLDFLVARSVAARHFQSRYTANVDSHAANKFSSLINPVRSCKLAHRIDSCANPILVYLFISRASARVSLARSLAIIHSEVDYSAAR